MRVKIDKGAILPTRAHEADAGLDLYATKDYVIYPYSEKYCGLYPNSVSIDTGVHLEIPLGYFGKIESRSGLNVKHNIVSCGGVVDSGYTGSIVVKLYNLGTEPYTFHKGDKIAQIVIQPCISPKLEVVDELSKTDRGNNGFGSSGV